MTKQFRDNVGIALFRSDGHVLIARRYQNDGPEIIQAGFEWQMPQGGINKSEDPFHAALRELFEETGVTSARYLSETEWLTYEFPPYSGPQDHRLARFHGQRQKWFALRFLGDETEIDVERMRCGQQPEFDMWRWEQLERLPNLVVPFKKEVYSIVIKAFSVFALSK